MLCIIAASVFRAIDRPFCSNADSVFQFHALFHIFIALGLFFAYFCARTLVLMSGKDNQQNVDLIQAHVVNSISIGVH